MLDIDRAGRVRDPVHGYVLFTGLERAILDHPIAQRLRHVAQSGMAQLVFPEVRSTRFSHSLGAMHLASRFLESAIRNAEPDVRDDIQRRLKDTVDEVGGLGVGGAEARLAISQRLARQGLRSGGTVDDRYRAYALLAEQGLRLAALFHDLGHLPFSHDFEYALEAVIREHRRQGGGALPVLGAVESLAIHERIGYQLASLLERQIFGELEEQEKWIEVTFLLAERILRAESTPDPDRHPLLGGPRSPTEGLLHWLHAMVASEVDVDRCDYILRDTRHYGLEFSSYDLDRLVDNLVATRSQAHPDGLFTAVRPQGQSALESFVVARFRMYQWAIFHHKVSQGAAALQKTIRDLLRPALTSGNDLTRFLEDIEAIAACENPIDFVDEKADVLVRFAGYDDVWWITRMRAFADESPTPWNQLVTRRKPGPESLWKRLPDFPGDLPKWNRRLPARHEDVAQARWYDAVDELEAEGILVLRHHFTPWKGRAVGLTSPSSLSVLTPDGQLTPLSKLSHMVRTLRESWMHEVQVQGFAERKGMVDPEQVVDRLPLVPRDQEEEHG